MIDWPQIRQFMTAHKQSQILKMAAIIALNQEIQTPVFSIKQKFSLALKYCKLRQTHHSTKPSAPNSTSISHTTENVLKDRSNFPPENIRLHGRFNSVEETYLMFSHGFVQSILISLLSCDPLIKLFPVVSENNRRQLQ